MCLSLPPAACSLSILLTYIFSKSPLFLALVRFLRSCMTVITQVRVCSLLCR